jgi:predicted RNA-binding Zn ribbon-like protein
MMVRVNGRGDSGSRMAGLALVGGALALDFANTAAGRGTAEPVERLTSVSDLVDWAAHAGAIDAAALRRRRAQFAHAAQGVLRQARGLREAVHAVGAALARGEAPPRAALRTIGDAAQRALAQAELAPAGAGYALDFSAAPLEHALLGPVAWSALDLLRTGNFERLKSCPGPGCGWLFLDRSKNNSRRWCDMATCGNRTKAKRHRQRA